MLSTCLSIIILSDNTITVCLTNVSVRIRMYVALIKKDKYRCCQSKPLQSDMSPLNISIDHNQPACLFKLSINAVI